MGMIDTIVIRPVPSQRPGFNISCAGAIVANYHSIGFVELANKIINFMGDTGSGSIINANCFGVCINPDSAVKPCRR